MTLPYSDAIFVCAFPRECTEAFLEGHVRAFAFFGGVPAPDQLRQLQDRRRQDHSAAATARSPTRSCGSRATTCSSPTSAWCGGPTRRGTSRRWSATPAATSSCRSPSCTAAWSRSTPTSSARCRDDLSAAALGQAGDQGRPARRGAAGLPAAAGRGVRGRPGRAAVASTRCRWSASTPTSTRCRPSTPTTGSRSSPRWTSVRIVVGDRVGGDPPPVLGPRAGLLRPGALPGPAGAQARALDFAAPAGGLGAAGLLRRPAAAAGGRARRAGDAAVHQGPAAAGAGRASRS